MKAKKEEHLDNDAEPNPTISTLAHIVAYRQDEEHRGSIEKEENSTLPVDERHELLRLLRETQEQLNHLIVSGGDGDSKEVTRSARDVMREQKFKRWTREKVECDAAMKQFLCEYRLTIFVSLCLTLFCCLDLRNLQAKFAQAEEMAKHLCEGVDEVPSSNVASYPTSSRTMSYSSSSESTLADGEVRSRKKSVTPID
jgi:hypothetical protein